MRTTEPGAVAVPQPPAPPRSPVLPSTPRARRVPFARTASTLQHSFVAEGAGADQHSRASPLGSPFISSFAAMGAVDERMDDLSSDDALSRRRTPSISANPLDMLRVLKKPRTRPGSTVPSSPVLAGSPRRGVSESHLSTPSRRGSLSTTSSTATKSLHSADEAPEEDKRARVSRHTRHKALRFQPRAFGRITAELMQESRPGMAEERGEGAVRRNRVGSAPGRSVSAGSVSTAGSALWGPARASYPAESAAANGISLSGPRTSSFASLFRPVGNIEPVPESRMNIIVGGGKPVLAELQGDMMEDENEDALQTRIGRSLSKRAREDEPSPGPMKRRAVSPTRS